MRNVLFWLDPLDRLEICIDRSLSKSNREAFNEYTRDKASWVWNVELGRSPSLSRGQIRILHKRSEEEYCLQLADYVAGAIFQKYERGLDEYYKLFEDKIRSFNYLW